MYVLFGLVEIPPVKLNVRQVGTAKPKDKFINSLMAGDYTFWLTLMENAIGDLSTVLPVSGYCSTTLMRNRCLTHLMLWRVMLNHSGRFFRG